MPKHRNGQNGQQPAEDERTPLLEHRDSQEDASSRSGSDSGDNASLTTISDLGEFTAQPKELARIIADKDTEALQDLCDRVDGDVFALIQSDRKQGLQQDQYSEDGSKERLRIYGRNELPEKELKPFWRFLWEAFNDKVLIILTGLSSGEVKTTVLES